MRHNYLMGMALLPALMLMTACDGDNDGKSDAIPDNFNTRTYTGMKALDMEYNDADVAGKSVTVARAANGNADISFYSTVNLSTLSSDLSVIPEFPGPGVLPGTPELKINVPMRRDRDEWEFSYKGETEYVTYSVEGDFTDKIMECDFSNVKLKDLSMVTGAYKPMPVNSNPLADAQPFHIVWETNAPIQLPGLQYTLQDILRVLVNTPLIPVYNGTAEMSLSQVIANGLRQISLTADGCIPVTYLQTANGAAQFITAPRCTFMYVPLSAYAIKLYPNPTDLLSLVLLNNTNRGPNIPDNPFGKKSRAESGTLAQLLQGLLKTLTPMVADGIPMACVKQGNDMSIYLDTQLTVGMLKKGIVPLLSNPATRGIIQDLVEHNDKLAPYSTAIMALYDALPTILDQTSKLELGLNFTK